MEIELKHKNARFMRLVVGIASFILAIVWFLLANVVSILCLIFSFVFLIASIFNLYHFTKKYQYTSFNCISYRVLKDKIRKEKINKKNLLLVIFIVVGSFSFICLGYYFYMFNFNNGEITIEISFGDYVPENKNLYNDTYNGILIKSDINNFTKLKTYMDILNISKENYNLSFITHIQLNKDHCNGYYNPGNKSIKIYPCNKTLELRDYIIEPKEHELWVLGHELGHYVHETEVQDEQDWCDDFAHNLTKVGRKRDK